MRTPNAGNLSSPGREGLLNDLRRLNPYGALNAQGYRYDAQGWNSERETITELLNETRPELVIEVGSWKGGSAIYMGKFVKENHFNTKIICVDTWLSESPGLFQQFAANVIKSGLTDTIVPFPSESLCAAEWFRKKRISAGLIYIDASHEEADVSQDLSRYFELVAPGGVLFGDDYFEGEPGVIRAVDRFAAEKKLPLEVRENQFWIFRKQKESKL